ncbi:hypothetical protein [Pseudonocardia sp. MH-G8]|uniref:hypothetical protein n=1 Tax=Pseudonocardia sp. MH-G8 TaxID=1854588 RepID=UPI000BA0E162|nr:hypothetical protein [Pseudonocardia sp. MH-G8]OZM77273.1 hypothetical protein CFP66_37300 [Pseudonocardia sp. MH-G8]
MRAVLIAVAAILLMTGCSRTSAVVARAEQAGCLSVVAEYQRDATRTVLSLSARECRREGDDALLPAADALDVLQRLAWQARAAPFDTIYATVYRVAEAPDVLRSSAVETDRATATSRWGSRSADLASDSWPAGRSDIRWVLLFGAAAVGWLVVMVAVFKEVRAGRIVIVYFMR